MWMQCEVEDINAHLAERLPSRDHHVKAMQENELDVLVIGGGATGAGCALDAVSRGLLSFVSRSCKPHVVMT